MSATGEADGMGEDLIIFSHSVRWVCGPYEAEFLPESQNAQNAQRELMSFIRLADAELRLFILVGCPLRDSAAVACDE